MVAEGGKRTFVAKIYKPSALSFLPVKIRAVVKPDEHAVPARALTQEDLELHRLIAAAPSKNWRFHASDLRRLIGQPAYDTRVRDLVLRFTCPKFAAVLAVHGQAVLEGEIPR